MEETINHLEFIISHTGKTSKHLDNSELTSTQLFCFGLLERLQNASLALKILLQTISCNPSLEFSCGIILRSCLLDSLIALNLYKILLDNEKGSKSEEEKENNVKEFCEENLSDGLSATIKYISAAKDANIITQSQLKETFKNMANNYSTFFKPYPDDGSIPLLKYSKYYAPAELFKNLANSQELKELTKIYDEYLFFSKYDHFGILYYEVARQNFSEQMERIKKGIELFIGTQSILHFTLLKYSRDDTFLSNQSNIATEYLHTKIFSQP